MFGSVGDDKQLIIWDTRQSGTVSGHYPVGMPITAAAALTTQYDVHAELCGSDHL